MGAGAYSQAMLLDSVVWLGHSGFRLSTGRSTVYIDPYRAPEGPKADLILITHGHYDHFSLQDVERPVLNRKPECPSHTTESRSIA